MHIFDLFTKAELDDQIANKMVKVTPHPSGSLSILNYTQQASFTPEHWNHVTDICRGLIVAVDGTVVARSFEKFWNLDDLRHPETLMANLPSTPPTLTQKMDGSLGIAYTLDGVYYIATRGSFTSKQATWASAWVAGQSRFEWPTGYTPVFEIIYPANQIVVRYDFSGLVLLSMIEVDTGQEAERSAIEHFAQINGLRLAEQYHRGFAECALDDIPNEEGYVAAWSRPGRTPLRVKIKYENYVRLHRMLTQTNAVTVWEILRDGLDLSALTQNVPEEFRVWIEELKKRFTEEFKAIEKSALAAMLEYHGEKNILNPADKKSFALYATGLHAEVAPIMFAMVSGKNYASIIWKHICPRGDGKSYKVIES